MKSDIVNDKDDLCIACSDICPENIYDCEKRRQLQESNKLKYAWCWILKE